MKLKELQNKYPEYSLGRRLTSQGRYYFQLSPSRVEFFMNLHDMSRFILRHKDDISSGNMFKAVQND